MANEKRCTRCKRRKAIHLFNKSQQSKDGYSHWCKACSRKYVAKRRAESPQLREQNRWAARTHSRALSRLKEKHQEEFKEILTEIRTKETSP